MNAWSKRLIFTVAVMTVAWLTGVGFATTASSPATLSSPATVVDQSSTSPAHDGTAIPVSMASTFEQARGGAAQTPARGAAPAGGAQAAGRAATAGMTPAQILEAGALGNLKSEQVFKNVQVLKGITVDEFMGTMGVFTTSLSLCCGNCHPGAGTSDPKWNIDTNPRKVRARQMVRMVNAINQTNFGGRKVVTCWTCHRGQLSPSVTAPLDFAYGDTVVVPGDVLTKDPNSEKPTVDDVLNNYIQAIGGQAAADRLTSYVAHGRSLLFGEVGEGNPSEIYAQANGKVTTMVHQQEGDVVRAFDGMTAWWQIPLTVTPQYKLGKSLLDGARFDAAMAFPWKIKPFFNNWRRSYPISIDGADVDVIQGNLPARPGEAVGMVGTLYFDQKTHLLKRYIRYANTIIGRIPTQVDLSDYRPVNGVLMPFKYSYAWVSERDDWTFQNYDVNPQIDQTKFNRPDPKTAGDPHERSGANPGSGGENPARK